MSNPYSQDYDRTQQASVHQQETSQQAYVQAYDSEPTSKEVVPGRQDTSPQPQLAETSVQRFDFDQPQYEPSVTPQYDYHQQQGYGQPYGQQHYAPQYAQPQYAPAPYAQPHYAPAMTTVGMTKQPVSGALVAIAWIVAILTLLYMLPWAIAVTRNHRNMAVIGLVNFFLGWTFIGWIGSLIMACVDNNQTNVVVVNQAPQQYYQQPPRY